MSRRLLTYLVLRKIKSMSKPKDRLFSWPSLRVESPRDNDFQPRWFPKSQLAVLELRIHTTFRVVRVWRRLCCVRSWRRCCICCFRRMDLYCFWNKLQFLPRSYTHNFFDNVLVSPCLFRRQMAWRSLVRLFVAIALTACLTTTLAIHGSSMHTSSLLFLLSDCCKFGLCHPLLCMACWCTPCALGQISKSQAVALVIESEIFWNYSNKFRLSQWNAWEWTSVASRIITIVDLVPSSLFCGWRSLPFLSITLLEAWVLWFCLSIVWF